MDTNTHEWEMEFKKSILTKRIIYSPEPVLGFSDSCLFVSIRG